ncbi:translation initiation factor IF-3 [Caldanaerobius polysaccharolyticus]|nr:translation initiation factor IF-3 [Caldanaerobius polysaccharolyticus]
MFRRCVFINNNDLQVNEEIRDKEVRLIDVDGQQLGIMSARDAQIIANKRQLDLVKVAPMANPPVCKLMDYGKYKYQMTKKEKEARKKQKTIEVKEIRMTPGIEEHDFNVKVKNAQKFLKDGNKVKVTIRFRGREMNYTDIATDLLNKFADKLKEEGSVEKKPVIDNKNMYMIISPK